MGQVSYQTALRRDDELKNNAQRVSENVNNAKKEVANHDHHLSERELMQQWEAYAIGADRRTTILAVGRYDKCAEAAHLAAFEVFESLKAKDRRTFADDLRIIKERTDGEPRGWVWALGGVTFGVRKQQPEPAI